MRLTLAFILMAMLTTAVNSYAAPSRYYRYEDDKGVKVIRDTIPARFVHKGYDILNKNGRLIERVPRSLSKEELAAKKAKAEREGVLAEQAAKQAEADKRLLTIFSQPEDAERARDRKLDALDGLIKVDRGNILRLQSEYEQVQQMAANRERAGLVVPKHLIEKLDSLQRQTQNLQDAIEQKQDEKVQVRKDYAKDIERLKYLKTHGLTDPEAASKVKVKVSESKLPR